MPIGLMRKVWRVLGVADGPTLLFPGPRDPANGEATSTLGPGATIHWTKHSVLETRLIETGIWLSDKLADATPADRCPLGVQGV